MVAGGVAGKLYQTLALDFALADSSAATATMLAAVSLSLSMRRNEQRDRLRSQSGENLFQFNCRPLLLHCSTVCSLPRGKAAHFKFRRRNTLLCLKFKLCSPVSGPHHALAPTLCLVCVSQLKRLKCFLTTKTGTATTTAHAMINLLYPIWCCWLPFAVLAPLALLLTEHLSCALWLFHSLCLIRIAYSPTLRCQTIFIAYFSARTPKITSLSRTPLL